jgi:hypothetical protein
MTGAVGEDIYRSKGGWPYPGTVPPISTLADIFLKTDPESDGLKIGFTTYLLTKGTDEQYQAFNFYLVNPSEINGIDATMAVAIEEHFAEYFWATELEKYRVTMGDGSVVTPTLDNDLEVGRPVRYWNEDLTTYAFDYDMNTYVAADGAVPTLNYDRYHDGENWMFITGLNPLRFDLEAVPDFDTVRYWNADLTAYATMADMNTYVAADGVQPKLHLDRYYDEASQNWMFLTSLDPSGPALGDDFDPRAAGRSRVAPGDASGLIALQSTIKKAVAYTAVRAKRRKELIVDRPARELMSDAVREVGGDATLIGEQFSMKGAKSIVEKAIEDSMKAVGAAAVLDAVEQISDGVRYTMQLPKETYTDGVRGYLAFFASNGWKNTKFGNSWTKPLASGYRGINTKWAVALTIDGQPATEVVEVQFHTPESFHAKEDGTHALKEQIRVLSNALAENRKRLDTLSVEMPEHARLSEEIERQSAEVDRLDREQRQVFEDMAATHTPEGAAGITL